MVDIQVGNFVRDFENVFLLNFSLEFYKRIQATVLKKEDNFVVYIEQITLLFSIKPGRVIKISPIIVLLDSVKNYIVLTL